jgi:hypothetical protein
MTRAARTPRTPSARTPSARTPSAPTPSARTRSARTRSAATDAPSTKAKAPSAGPATILSSAAEMRGRERHFPRLCQSCQAPMAVQEDNCWACGATWDSSRIAQHAEDQPPDRAVAA